jgi:hypothetical protein
MTIPTPQEVQQWTMGAHGLRVFACDCIPDNAHGQIATVAESKRDDCVGKLRDVVLADDAAAALAAYQQEVERLRERVRWFESSGGVAVHTRVFQEIAKREAAEARVRELEHPCDCCRARMNRKDGCANGCRCKFFALAKATSPIHTEEP